MGLHTPNQSHRLWGVDRLLLQDGAELRLDGELCMFHLDSPGRVRWLALCRGRSIAAGEARLQVTSRTDLVEVRIDEDEEPSIISDDPKLVECVRR